MRVVVQRARSARVEVDQEVVGEIEHGLVCLVGFVPEDTCETIDAMVEKISYLRIFDDEAGKMNRSLRDSGGSILSVSQFTLLGDCRKGRRPNFTAAAPSDQARELYQQWNLAWRDRGIHVATGVFGAMMQVTLTNDGPVTFVLEG